nr:pectinesterase-like [Ipomoea batatas]
MGDGDKNKKVAIAGVASILLVACVVAATVSLAKKGGSYEVTTTTKEVDAICAPTDYKETCKNSLSGAANTNDPKELLKTAFQVTMKNISDAISRSALLKKAAKDPRTSDALDLCKTLLNNSIGDLEKSYDAAGNFDVNNILEYASDLKVWLSGAITQQETCLDAFENTTGDTGEKMKNLLKISGELTSNGLAIITHFTEAASTLETTNSRRLLSDKHGFPSFIDATARRLLNANPGSIKPNVVVAKDGSGDFKSINDAIKNAPAPPKNINVTYVIKIKAGVYNEYVVVPRTMNHVVFIGDGPTKTKITGNKNYFDGIGTYQTATVAIEGDHFTARDIGFENSAGANKHQAVALRVSSDHAIFSNCAIDAYQDTIYAHAYRQYYRDCSISGTIDFIFGDASSVFQNCKMIVRKPLQNQACMVTAQGRMERRGVGAIVLQNCEILPAPELKTLHPPAQVFLGRPWKQYARTLIAESFIDGFIAPEGWAPWNGNFALDTLWYAEYQNRGPGSDTSKRVNWKGYLKNISPQEVSKFSAGVYIQADQWIKPTGISYDSA